nr:MAG TPA: hypothetical protein [Caudoviricetes sp.]
MFPFRFLFLLLIFFSNRRVDGNYPSGSPLMVRQEHTLFMSITSFFLII